jgi:hypothetical protein
MFRLIKTTTKWSKPFSEYYIHRIHPQIHHIGLWELAQFDLPSITTNQSESFNCVLKRINNWKECPIDAMVLSLFRLAQYHLAELNRGRCDLGNYELREGLEAEAAPLNGDVVTAPCDIIQSIRSASTPPAPTVPPASPPTLTTSSPSSTPTEPPTTSSSAPNDDESVRHQTVYERAAHIIDNNKLSLDAKLGIFTVVGTSEPRVVKLFPKSTCSCPARNGCYHTVAAKMAVGLKEKPKRPTINLTQLRCNTRKKPDKTAGRKRPRIGDMDVVAAPDADAAVAAGINGDDDIEPSGASPPPPPPQSSKDLCAECGLREPPKKVSRRKLIQWIECEMCHYWYHICCVRDRDVPQQVSGHFFCIRCDCN